MTKTEATKRARAQLRYGHFVTSMTTGHANCPDCRSQVSTQWLPWEKPEPAIRSALIAHLMSNCATD